MKQQPENSLILERRYEIRLAQALCCEAPHGRFSVVYRLSFGAQPQRGCHVPCLQRGPGVTFIHNEGLQERRLLGLL